MQNRRINIRQTTLLAHHCKGLWVIAVGRKFGWPAYYVGSRVGYAVINSILRAKIKYAQHILSKVVAVVLLGLRLQLASAAKPTAIALMFPLH